MALNNIEAGKHALVSDEALAMAAAIFSCCAEDIHDRPAALTYARTIDQRRQPEDVTRRSSSEALTGLIPFALFRTSEEHLLQ